MRSKGEQGHLRSGLSRSVRTVSFGLSGKSDLQQIGSQNGRPKLVLASSSPRRLALLQQIGIEPDALMPANADETPGRWETPRELARRLSQEKAGVAYRAVEHQEALRGSYILAADTVVGVGRRILPKAEVLDQARWCLDYLSGRAHKVYTGICLVSPAGKVRDRVIETRVRFKRLSEAEFSSYLDAGEWRGKAGGYAIQGIAGSFVMKIVGSYSNVVGLPLYETSILLEGEGFPVRYGWCE